MKHLRRDYDGIQDASGKIPEDEPVFIIRAKDPCASATVAYWAYEQARHGADRAFTEAVFEWSTEMDRYRQERYAGDGRAHADVPDGALRDRGEW